MKKNIIVLFTITILSFSLTLMNINYLSAFAITNIDEVFSILAKAWRILHLDTPEKYWLIGYVLSAIISCGASTIIILKLRDNILTGDHNQSYVIKTISFFWLLLLSINVLLSLYYLLFVFMGLLMVALMILIILAVAAGQGRGAGSVHVRGHYRKGSWVHSHQRNRPRH